MERFGPTRRGGPVFRWLGMPLALDFANTVMVVRPSYDVDLLAGPAELAVWLAAERDRLGDCGFALSHLDVIRDLRDAIRGLLHAVVRREMPAAEVTATLNAASGAVPVAPQLAANDEADLQIVETTQISDPLAALLGKLARSAISLVTGPEQAELRHCQAPSCGMFFLGNRTWCTPACGNRARVARHHHERSQR